MERRGWGRCDLLVAVALALLTLLLSLGMMDRGHQWSDDFAGYMLEARAIAEGTVREQVELNEVLHPSRRDYGKDKADGPLAYVWGLPMMLSVIYRLVGYDVPQGMNIIWFKLPGVLMLAASAAIAYLFFRRRFCRAASAGLSVLLCLNCEMLTESSYVQTDIPCMAVSLLALLLIEVFLEQKRAGRRLMTGIALGAAMWFACELRLNGKTVAAVIALAQAIGLLREKPRGRVVLLHALPWIVMAALWGVTRLFLPAATSNTSHIAGGPNWWILHNIRAYDEEISRWLVRMLPKGMPLASGVRFLFYALVLVGMAAHGLKQNLHLTVLVAGTMAVLFLLPYYQGLRYMFNILPLLLMFAACGAGTLADGLARHPTARSAVRGIFGVVLALMVLGTAQWTADQEARHLRAGGADQRYDAYSDRLTDMYSYIYGQTEKDAVIAFFKPRLLYLNTERVSFAPDIAGHRLTDADYILLASDPALDYVREGISPGLWARMALVYDNGGYELYRIGAERESE